MKLNVPDHSIEAAKEAALRKALRKTKGHRAKAAELLGVSVKTVYNLCERYGIQSGDAP